MLMLWNLRRRRCCCREKYEPGLFLMRTAASAGVRPDPRAAIALCEGPEAAHDLTGIGCPVTF